MLKKIEYIYIYIKESYLFVRMKKIKIKYYWYYYWEINNTNFIIVVDNFKIVKSINKVILKSKISC